MQTIFKKVFKNCKFFTLLSYEIIHNTGWLIIEKILRLFIGITVTGLIARYLGPQQFGILNYAITLVALLTVVAYLGLDDIIIRNLVQNINNRNMILGTAFILKLLGGIIHVVLCILLIKFLKPYDKLILWMVFIISLGTLAQVFDIIDFWFRSQLLAKYMVCSKLIAFVVTRICYIILIFLNAPLLTFGCIITMEYFIIAIGLIIMYKKTGQNITNFSFKYKYAKTLMKDSYPLIFTGLMLALYMRIDQIMLAQLCNEKELGIYSVAVRLSEFLLFISGAFVSSFFPSIIKAKKISEDFLYVKIKKVYNFMTFIGYIMAGFLTLNASWIIELLFGGEYKKAVPSLIILGWSILFINLGIARTAFLVTMNWGKVYFFSTLSGVIINVILNIYLIPQYKSIGAAVSSLITYWFVTHGFCFFYKPLHKTGIIMFKSLLFPWTWRF